MSEIKFTINGKQITGTCGQTILEAALDNGIEIPNLCHDSRLVPSGACRLCLVQVEGMNKEVTACTHKISDSMVVSSESEPVRATRKTVLELLFTEHQGQCATCDDNGECKLQRYAYEYQVSDEIIGQCQPVEHADNYTTGNKAI